MPTHKQTEAEQRRELEEDMLEQWTWPKNPTPDLHDALINMLVQGQGPKKDCRDQEDTLK